MTSPRSRISTIGRRPMPRLAVLVCLFFASPVFALDPMHPVAQLKVTVWGADRGAPPDIFRVAQSPDGFLWLGTSSGLYRFDGVTFEKVPTIPGDRTRSQQVTAILAARDGSVWVGYYWGGLSVYRNGLLKDANHGTPTGSVWDIVQGPNGEIYVGTSGLKGAQISRYKAGRWTDAGVTLGLHASSFSGMTVAQDGALWVLSDNSIARLGADASKYTFLPNTNRGFALAEDPSGHIWSVGAKEMQRLPDLRTSPITLDEGVQTGGQVRRCALFDHDGDLFICRSDHKLDVLRAWTVSQGPGRQGKAVSKAEALEPVVDEPLAMIEDKEGDLWVGSSGGLEQIRDTNVVSKRLSKFPSRMGPWMVTASNANLYFGNGNDLEEIEPGGGFKDQAKIRSSSDLISTLCPDRQGGVWVALAASLRHWTSGLVEAIPSDPSWDRQSINACAVDGAGDLWVSVTFKGLFRRRAGAWGRITLDPAFPSMWSSTLTADRQGRILAYYGRGRLDRLSGTSVERLGSTDALGGDIRTVYPRSGDILIGGDKGLGRYDGHRWQVISSDDYPWLASLSGIVQTPAGDTWLNGAQGIARVRTSDLEAAFSNPHRPITHELFDFNDGLQGSVIRLADYEGGLSSDGRVWFQSTNGLVSIDPAHLIRNSASPLVVIKSITADERLYRPVDGLSLPAGVKDLQVDYTALSLAIPSRNQFRYRLDGIDKGWVDPGSRRQAFYTNLNPGHYQFHVIGSNNDGVWNKTGATLRFQIRPAFWQTPMFLLVAVLALTTLLWALYSLWLQEMARRIRLRLEDRVAERERIARELHDTLLQGFQGLTMRLQSVAEQIPPTEPSRALLDQALDRADEVLVEGRDKVKNLRSGEGDGELAFLLEASAYRLRVNPEIAINMMVKGDCRSLHPVVCEELLAIANEALFNAFKHASATQIDLSLACEPRNMRMRIADNGVGFDKAVLAATRRAGRYGLVGIRERARKLKAKVHIGNRQIGAEVLVVVPRRVAYASLKPRQSLFPRRMGLES